MLGKFEVMSRWRSAIEIATLRAIAPVGFRDPPAGVGDDRRLAGRRCARESAMSSGSWPRISTPYSFAMRSPPPAPKMCSSWPQFEQTVRAHVLDDAENRE